MNAVAPDAIAPASVTDPAPSPPRIDRIDAATLNTDYLSSSSSAPVVISRLSETWNAMDKWTFDHFEKTYGEEKVLVTDHLGSSILKKVSLKTYLSYVKEPTIDLFPGTKIDTPWYAPYWSPLSTHPELLTDFDVSPSVENWLPEQAEPAKGVEATTAEAMMNQWALRGFTWLFIGPKGTYTPRHVDTLNTHAWNAQIEGAKRFDIWEPDQSSETPDFSVVLTKGDVLIIPAGWSHCVHSLAPSISLTGNFFNRTNCAAFFEAIYTSPGEWAAKGRLVPELKAKIAP